MTASPETRIDLRPDKELGSIAHRSLLSPVTQRFIVETAGMENEVVFPQLFRDLDQRHIQASEKLPQISPSDIEIILGYPQVDQHLDIPSTVERSSQTSLIRLTNTIRRAALHKVSPGNYIGTNKFEAIAVNTMYGNMPTPESDEQAVETAIKIWSNLREMYVFVGQKPNTKLSIEGWAASSKLVRDIWYDQKTISAEEEIGRLLTSEARKNDNTIFANGPLEELSFEMQSWLTPTLNQGQQTILRTQLGALPITSMIDSQFHCGNMSIILSTHIGSPDRLLLWPDRVKALLKEVCATSETTNGRYTDWDPQKIKMHHHFYKVYDPRHHLPYLVSTDPINQEEAMEMVDRLETSIIILSTETDYFRRKKRQRKSAIVLPHFPKANDGAHVQVKLF